MLRCFVGLLRLWGFVMAEKREVITVIEQPRKRGGQTIYDPEIADDIIERLTHGEILRKICKLAGYPNDSTVQSWKKLNIDGFGDRYAEAREAGWHVIAEEIIEIADDSSNDIVIEDGKERVNTENTQRSRLRVDTRKWMLAKMLPKIYGDSTTIKGDKENPLVIGFADKLDAATKRIAPPQDEE